MCVVQVLKTEWRGLQKAAGSGIVHPGTSDWNGIDHTEASDWSAVSATIAIADVDRVYNKC